MEPDWSSACTYLWETVRILPADTDWTGTRRAALRNAGVLERNMDDPSNGTDANGNKRPKLLKRSFSFVSPVLAGLALAIALGLFSPHLAVGPGFYEILIFAAGAAAAVLVLRLLVQREHRVALQLVVSEIVRENTSPEVAAMRIVEALCISQGWDVAVRWEVSAEEDRLEFCSSWSAPGRPTEALIQESMALHLTRGDELAGRVWQDGHAIWIANLGSGAQTAHTKAAISQGMVSGCAVPVRVGNRVLAVLEFYCHFCLRENTEAMAAVETVAASVGQMLAHSHERGRAEKLYREQKILLDSVADGIFGLDPDGLVSFANPAAARLLGASPASLTGKPVHDLLHGCASLSNQCGEDCALLHATGSLRLLATSSEETLFRVDGSSFRVDYALTPIIDDGRLTGSVFSFRDISQRYALDRLKDEFISTVSHELRTPLTAICGALGLLSFGNLGPVNEKAANLLRIALANSDRLVRLINDILDLDRIQSGRQHFAFRPVQLVQIVRQAIDGMTPVAEAAHVRLIHDSVPVEIVADPDRLLQVLTNLLSNAVKFSPPNATVSILISRGEDGVNLAVVDEGRGIPEEKLEAIFGRFQQVDASDSRQKGGTGLGLAICRTIVQQHTGRIWAERNSGRGSTFRVFLPYKPKSVGLADPAFDPEACNRMVLLSEEEETVARPHLVRTGSSIN
jgi:PAS domain S-box-containing protein